MERAEREREREKEKEKMKGKKKDFQANEMEESNFQFACSVNWTDLI